MFRIQVTQAPSHSLYAVGKFLRNKNEIAICVDRPQQWATRAGAERNVPTWAGWTFAIVEA